ncbi:MFS transporter [Desertimonas flava]|uniref:MFS transporter n=1 Tax=Desertimonas flava TaxID=2064846 RepID=UPI0013C4FB14|nr:MFS transporter [Desertimonas flava]
MTSSEARERVVLTGPERAELQRRTLRALATGQIVGAAALASAVTVGAFVVQDILGQDTPWAGAATATVTTGTALMAQVLSRRMQRLGRRPGLVLGYRLAAVGGAIAVVGVETQMLAVFLVGLFLFGNGQAANLLARYAATDLAEPAERSRAMSSIVFASTFGAVAGPLLVGPAEHAGEAWLGVERYSGPWLCSAVFFVLASTITTIRLRPDPLVAAGGVAAAGIDRRPPALGATFRAVADHAGARLAVTAMVVSQVTMVAVMAMTPVHLKLHGHEGVSQYVVSLHIAGMFAFSPLVGRYSDRRGRRSAIAVGAVLLVVAGSTAALSGDVEQLLFPSLWLLGIGWNFGLIGGSSLLVESVPAAQRVAVQGSADLAMSLCGGIAGFASGFVRRAVGYHVLATLATVAAGALLVAAFIAHLRSRSLVGDVAPVPAAD